jgi:hypothetical protein
MQSVQIKNPDTKASGFEITKVLENIELLTIVILLTSSF